MFRKKIKFLFHIFASVIVISIIIVLPAFSCYAVSNSESFVNFTNNQIKIGWSNVNNQGTTNSYAFGDEVGIQYNSSDSLGDYTRFWSKTDLSSSLSVDSSKPSTFSLSTALSDGQYKLSREPFITINPVYEGTFFSFNIRVWARFSSDEPGGNVGIAMNSLKVWEIPDIMKGQLYISEKADVLKAHLIRPLRVDLVNHSNIVLIYNYAFIVPPGGLDIYGFFFNYPITVGIDFPTDNIYGDLEFRVTDFVLDSQNVYVNNTLMISTIDKINLLKDETVSYWGSGANSIDDLRLNGVLSNSGGLLESMTYLSRVIDSFILDLPFVVPILSVSVFIGIAGFVVGLASKVFKG